MRLKVVMAGGGTAGHTSPLIATAQQLAELAEAEITCVGTAKGLETRVIPEAGLDLELIPPVPLPRRLTPELFAVPLRLLQAVRQARAILRNHHAQVAVGFGGYVSLPVYLAARLARIPLVLHEGNAVPGLANRVAARFTPYVATTYADTKLPHATHLGLPVRAAIAGLDREAAKAGARASFGLPAEGPVLLVSGGSQGARSLNAATTAAAEELLASGISILHVLGAANLTSETVARQDPATGASYLPVGYVDDMAAAYAAADLMLARSGAGTVMETAMTGLVTIFVPLPHGNGEQARNADFLIEAKAGVLVPDSELDGARVVAEVTALLADPAALAAMSDRCRQLVPADASVELARLVIQAAQS